MTFEERRQRAIAVLNRHGIPQHTSEPVQLRLFRKLGMQVRPLHFESFWRTAFVHAVWFAPFWALIMWIFRWRTDGTHPALGLLGAVICGLCYGLAMAGVYAWAKKKYRLPTWESLGCLTTDSK